MHPPRQVGRFVVGEFLGNGSYGWVYRGQDVVTGRQVALKLASTTDPRRAADFRAECEMLAKVNHPNVVKVVDTGTEGDFVWQAHDLIEGRTLAAHLASAAPSTFVFNVGTPRSDSTPSAPAANSSDPRPSIERITQWFLGAARGLAAMHAVGLIHRDIKPGNIMIGPDDQAVLIDLGLAISTDEIGDGPLDQAGTWHYMSPEQVANGALGLTPRSDIYSLGATFYEAFTGHRLVSSTTVGQIKNEIMFGALPRPSSIEPRLPPALDRLLLRCLEKQASRRHDHGHELAREIERESASASTMTGGPATRAEPSFWRRRRRGLVLAGGLVLAASLTLLFLHHRRQQAIAEMIRAARDAEKTNVADAINVLGDGLRDWGPDPSLTNEVATMVRADGERLRDDFLSQVTITHSDPAVLAALKPCVEAAATGLSVTSDANLRCILTIEAVLRRDVPRAWSLIGTPHDRPADQPQVALVQSIVALAGRDGAAFDAARDAEIRWAGGPIAGRFRDAELAAWRDIWAHRLSAANANRPTSRPSFRPQPARPLAAVEQELQVVANRDPTSRMARSLLGILAWDANGFDTARTHFEFVWHESGSSPAIAHLMMAATAAGFFSLPDDVAISDPRQLALSTELDAAAHQSAASWSTFFEKVRSKVLARPETALRTCRVAGARWVASPQLAPPAYVTALSQCAIAMRVTGSNTTEAGIVALESLWELVAGWREPPPTPRAINERRQVLEELLAAHEAVVNDRNTPRPKAAAALQKIADLVMAELSGAGDPGYAVNLIELRAIESARKLDAAMGRTECIRGERSRLRSALGDRGYWQRERDRIEDSEIRASFPKYWDAAAELLSIDP